MLLKSKLFQLLIAIGLGVIVILLPRPEGTKFKVTNDEGKKFYESIKNDFILIPSFEKKSQSYFVEIRDSENDKASIEYLQNKIAELDLNNITLDYENGLSPKAQRFLAIMVALIFIFIVEPIPLEIAAICIGVFLVIMGISDVTRAWAPYMNPVVIFIMCCLIFAISLEKAGLTKRLGYFIVRKAGTNVTKFTFVIACSLGFASAFMHDAAAASIGIVTILPLMRAAGIAPYSNTGKFMMLSIPFAASCGGMGSLIGGGRCMVAAAFLKEFTGLEISFFDWIIYAMPAALLTVPVAVFTVYLIFRPDKNIKLPVFDEKLGPLTTIEKKTLLIIAATFILWLTTGWHGIHYSVTGML